MSLGTRKSIALLQSEAAGEGIDESQKLRRVLGPLNLTTLGIGAIIGAGIFVLTGEAGYFACTVISLLTDFTPLVARASFTAWSDFAAGSGFHSNGYSLVRKVVESAKLTMTDIVPDLGTTVGEALLTPTMIYAKPIRRLLDAVQTAEFAVSGLANITGGGIPDNLGRVLPPGCQAVVHRAAWPSPPLFDWLQFIGNIADAEMDRVFNRGVGFVVVCRPAAVGAVLANLGDNGLTAWPIGEIGLPDSAELLRRRSGVCGAQRL